MISSRLRGPLGVQIIGVLKLVTAVLGMAVGLGLFRLFKSDVAASLEQVIRHLHLDPENRLVHRAISWISGLQPKQLHLIEAGTFFYVSLHTIEGVGLLTGRRWGAFLTILATSSLIPLECYEIYERPRPLRIAVDANGNEVAFDLRNGPPAGTTPLFPPPEVLDNVQNVIGYTPAQAAANGTAGVTAENGQVDNLQLTASQEADLVNFLKILTDGYTKPGRKTWSVIETALPRLFELRSFSLVGIALVPPKR